MTSQSDHVVIIKLNTHGEETWRYKGRILSQNKHSRLIEAFFNRSDLFFHGITLKENDRFIERYYNNRWYNIFEIHDREDDHIKGWYCNVTQPAEFHPGKIIYVDLALDVLVYPDGRYLILDEDEFAALDIDNQVRIKAHQALETLISMTNSGDLGKYLRLKKDAP